MEKLIKALFIVLLLALAFGLSCLYALAFQYIMLTLCGIQLTYWKSWWLICLIRFCIDETGIGKSITKIQEYKDEQESVL